MAFYDAKQIDQQDVDLFSTFGVDRHPSTEAPSEVACARMFNVDCAPTIGWDKASQMKYIEKPFVFNDIKVPLWTIRNRPPTRGVKNAVQPCDHLREGISTDPPGSASRIEALVNHYDGVDWDSEEGDGNESAFDSAPKQPSCPKCGNAVDQEGCYFCDTAKVW